MSNPPTLGAVVTLDQYRQMRALFARSLLQEIVDLGWTPGEKRGIALWEEATRLLANPDATEQQLKMLLGTIFRFAEARQQRLPPSEEYTDRVMAVYERLEAFIYPEASR